MEYAIMAIRHELRREIVRTLRDEGRSMEVEEIATSTNERIQLVHIHLPKLAELGVIEYDGVVLEPADRFEEVAEVLEKVETVTA